MPLSATVNLRSRTDNSKPYNSSSAGWFSAWRYTVEQEPTLARLPSPSFLSHFLTPQVSNYRAYNAYVSLRVHDRDSHPYKITGKFNTSLNLKHYVLETLFAKFRYAISGFVMSVCPSACYNSAQTRWIFVKSYTGGHHAHPEIFFGKGLNP